MKQTTRIFVTIFMVAVLICSPLTVLAQSTSTADTADINIADVNIITQVGIDHSSPVINLSSKIKSNSAAKKAFGISALTTTNVISTSLYLQNNPRLIADGALSEESNLNYVFFSVTKDTFMFSKLVTVNRDYKLKLYKIDDLTGNAVPTNASDDPNLTLAINPLQAGNYLFLISSAGTVGDPYTLQINATNPAGEFDSINRISSTLQQLVISYKNNEVYANGTYVFSWDPSVSNSHLNWTRDFNVDIDGVIQTKKMSLGNVKVRTFSGPVTYTSKYASSDNALLLYLDAGTAYTYFESLYNSVTGDYSSSFKDPTGKDTPRLLDETDLASGDQIIVFDLNTGKTIDFLSNLNYFYNENSADKETLPTIIYND
jgi:hypothetical protein